MPSSTTCICSRKSGRSTWSLLSGDHVYRMNYERLLEHHIEQKAEVTIACTETSVEEAGAWASSASRRDRIRAFRRSRRSRAPSPGQPDRALVNMGIYVFDTERLVRALIADAKTSSTHDFGHDILPKLIHSHHVGAFDVQRGLPREEHYWQDVGTLDSYFDANMELLRPAPAFDLYDRDWPLRTYFAAHPPALVHDAGEHRAHVLDAPALPRLPHPRRQRPGFDPLARGADRTGRHGRGLDPHAAASASARTASSAAPSSTRSPGAPRHPHRLDDDDRRRFVVTEGGVTVVPEGTLI